MNNNTSRPTASGARQLPEALQLRPFHADEAVRAGLTRGQLRGGAVRRVFRDVYVDPALDLNLDLRAACALATHGPGARISHRTAATLHRLPLPDDPDIHVSVARAGDRRFHTGIVSHLGAGASTSIRGVAVSTELQTFSELVNHLPLVDIVAIGDAIVQRNLLDAQTFRKELDRCGCRSPARAALAARLVRERVESPMESRLRLLLTLAGLPEPVVDHHIVDEYGRTFIRLDLAYPSVRLGVEYEGRQHADSPDQWHRDIGRREWFDLNGWRDVVVTADGIYGDPEGTLQRVQSALRERGVGCAIVSEEWRRHFPGRNRV